MAVLYGPPPWETLSGERAFTRAAAHELKTPLRCSRTHAEALRRHCPGPGGIPWTWCWTRATAWPLWWAACWSSPAWRRAGRRTGGAGDGRPGAGGGSLTGWPSHWSAERAPPEAESGAWTGIRRPGTAESAVENPGLQCPAVYAGGGRGVGAAGTGRRLAPRLAVDNDGPISPTAELTHLFEPFYRGCGPATALLGVRGWGWRHCQTAAAAHGDLLGGEPGGRRGSGWEPPALQSVQRYDMISSQIK